MIPATDRRSAATLAVALGAGILLAACAGPSPSATASAAATPPASAAGPIATPAASTAPSVAPSAVPSGSPTATPASTPSASVACAMPPAGILPSDRFTQVQVIPGGTADGLRFIFGNSSLPGPATPPMGSIAVATPPYTQAGSGAPIDVKGQHVLQLRFDGMSVQNDVGQPTYVGPDELQPNLPAIKDAVLYDASEGVIGWYIGYDGRGCPTVARDGQGLVLTIPHA
jgi:hypothetical protein